MQNFKSIINDKLKILFILLILIPIFWIFRYTYLPIGDYYQHIAGSYIFLNSSDPFLAHYFSSNFSLSPYLVQDLILILFGYFLGVEIAGKILLLIILVLLPLSSYYLISKINKEKWWLAFLTLPLLWNKLLFKGNLNFLMSIGVALFVIALFWDIFINKKNTKMVYIKFSLSLSILFLTHLIGLFLTSIPIFFLLLYVRLKKQSIHKFFYFSIIPTICLVLNFLINKPSLNTGSHLLNFKLEGKIDLISQMLLNFSYREWNSQLFYLVLLGSLFLYGLKEFKRKVPILIIILPLVILYLISPLENLGPLVRPYERIFFLLLFLLPIFFINKKEMAWEKFVIIIISSAIFLNLSFYHFKNAKKIEPYIKETIEMINSIPSNKKVYLVSLKHPYFGQIGVGVHLLCYYVILKNGYVSNMFATNYMLYRYNQERETDFSKLSDSEIKKYDYFFVNGYTKEFYTKMTNLNFILYKHNSHSFILKKNELK